MSKNAQADKAEDKKVEQAPLPSDKPNGLDAAALQRQFEALQENIKQLEARLAAQSGGQAAGPVEVKKTKEAGEYVATARGHIPGLGVIEPGSDIPADIPIGSWMKKAAKKKADVDEDGLDND